MMMMMMTFDDDDDESDDEKKKKVTRGLKIIEICVCDESLFPPFFVFLNFFYTTSWGQLF